VSLLFKGKDGNTEDQERQRRKDVTQYRPISLLCVDYKVLAKVLTTRLAPASAEVVHRQQAGFTPGRDIGGNNLFLDLVLTHCRKTNTRGYLVAIDIKKAFDSVDHAFLWRVLEAYGIPEECIRMVQTLYEGAGASLLVNGHISERFDFKAGVRQGCPLSPTLYVMVAELYLRALREHKDITGIEETISGRTAEVAAFADDTTLTLADKKSWELALDLLRDFGEVTGLHMHPGKTITMVLGGPLTEEERFTAEDDNRSARWTDDQAPVTITGMEYSPTIRKEQRTEGPLAKMKRASGWIFGLSQGRATRMWLWNVYGLGCLIYKGRTMVMPYSVAKELKLRQLMLLKRFGVPQQWNKCRAPVGQGGYGATDCEARLRALHVTWVKQWRQQDEELDDVDKSPWWHWFQREVTLWRRVQHRIQAESKRVELLVFDEELTVPISALKTWLVLGKQEEIKKWNEKCNEKQEDSIGLEALTQIQDPLVRLVVRGVSLERMTASNVYPFLEDRTNKLEETCHLLEEPWLSTATKEHVTRRLRKWYKLKRDEEDPRQAGRCPYCKEAEEKWKHHDAECKELNQVLQEASTILKGAVTLKDWCLKGVQKNDELKTAVAILSCVRWNHRREADYRTKNVINKWKQALEIYLLKRCLKAKPTGQLPHYWRDKAVCIQVSGRWIVQIKH
jgi:hypothetical protein